MYKNDDLKNIKKALKILLDVCITKKHESRDEFVIHVHENNKKLEEAIKLLEE